MLTALIDGFTERFQAAISGCDYSQLKLLDTACSRFLADNLPARDMSHDELLVLHDSLSRLYESYRAALKCCASAQESIQKELQQAGRSRRNTHHYLDVASNYGRL